MSHNTARSPVPAAVRRITAGLLLAAAIAAGTVAFRSALPWESLAGGFLRDDPGGTIGLADGVVTEDDGVLPGGATVFDDRYAGVGNLDPGLLLALRSAARDAADDGIGLYVNSGWRSPEYQEQLLDDAVSEYGSEEEAARWVATPETSPHVSGQAVDVGPFDAVDWLSDHGARYGLCQIYQNESWHFELRPGAIGGGCPARYSDPTGDPRMQP